MPKTLLNGLFTERGMDYQRRPEYLFVKDILVLKELCGNVDGTKT